MDQIDWFQGQEVHDRSVRIGKIVLKGSQIDEEESLDRRKLSQFRTNETYHAVEASRPVEYRP